MLVGLRRLRAGIAGVPEAFAVLGPGEAAAGGGKLHARDRRFDFLGRRHVEDVERAVFAAVFGQRYRDFGAVIGRHIPVDRDVAGSIQRVGIDQRLLAGRIGAGIQGHDHRLLQLGIGVGREHDIAARQEVEECRRRRRDQAGQFRLHRFLAGQGVEISVGARVLRDRPILHLLIRPVLQPAIRVGDFDALHHVRRCVRRCRRWCGNRRGHGSGRERNNNGCAECGFHRIAPQLKSMRRFCVASL
jgi:hypothetical protein